MHYEKPLLAQGRNYWVIGRTEWSHAHLKIHPIPQVMPSRMRFILVLIAFFALSGNAKAQLSTYVVAIDSSAFQFEVEHFGIATVNGVLSTGSGEVQYSPSFPDSISAQIVLDVSSVDTNNRLRDRELKSEDFLDAGRYPLVQFSSTGTVEDKVETSQVFAQGEMTIYGETRQLQLPLDVQEGDGVLIIRSAFSIRRQDFDIDFGILMNSLVSDEIKINVELVAYREN